jgi:pentatricopeptide repeat protein
MAFGQSTTTLDWCPQIIGDMLSTSAKAFSSQTVTEGANPTSEAIYEADRRTAAYDAEQSSSHRNEKNAPTLQSELTSNISASRNPIPTLSSPYSTPMPDVYTWSILLHIFMKHGQARAAEKVLTMMEARGVIPNQVTWNSLAAGYARMQDIGMTVGVIDRLEKAGFQADQFTKSGIAQIRDRRALIEAMKAKEDANDVANLEDRNKSSMTLSHLDHAIMIHGQLQEYLRDGSGIMFPVVKDI